MPSAAAPDVHLAQGQGAETGREDEPGGARLRGAGAREQLEWIADEAIEADGSAAIWLARPATAAQERELARGMADARAALGLATTAAAAWW